MKKIYDVSPGTWRYSARLLFTAILMMAFFSGNAQEQKVFYVSASIADHVYGAHDIARAKGYTTSYGRHMIPGAPLEWLWNHPDDGNKEPYKDLSAPDNIRKYNPQHLVLTPAGSRSAENAVQYGSLYTDVAQENNPDVNVYFLAHYPKYSDGIGDQGWIDNWTSPTYRRGEAYFEAVADGFKAKNPDVDQVNLIPVGRIMYALYQKAQNGGVPELTGLQDFYGPDNTHLSDKGKYVASVATYSTIFWADPQGAITSDLFYWTGRYGVSQAFAEAVWATAWEVIQNYSYSNQNRTFISPTGETQEPVAVLRSPENPANTVAGLNYSYYEGTWTLVPDFSALTPVKKGNTAGFDLSPRNREDNFAFRFNGYIQVPADGEYTFYTSSDDGSKLYIGNTAVVNNDGTHGLREQSGTIGLKAGKHAFSVHYFEATGSQTLSVSYAGPGITKKSIPASALSAAAPNTPPVAVLTVDKTSGPAPLTVNFNGGDSYDNDAGDGILGYAWTFGDGSTAGSEVAPSHTFTTPGTYTVTLTATDGNLAEGKATKEIVVTQATSGSVTTIYEAENAVITGGQIKSDHPGYTGTGFWAYVVSQGQKITFSVNSATGGNTELTTRYANGTTAPRLMSLYVNGSKIKQLSFPVTSTWSNWAEISESVALKAGENTVTIQFDAADNGHVNIDNISVTGSGNTGSTVGTVVMEKWTGITGKEVALIPVTTAPATTAELTSLETPAGMGDTYGVRVRGYIIPPATGSYTFYIASDDNGELWLSNNDQPEGKLKIAYVGTWTSSKEWNKFTSQKSAAKTLNAGEKYYFEALMKEETGGDNLAIGWTGPGISTISVIGGQNIASFGAVSGTDPAGATITVNSGTEYQTMDGFGFFGSMDTWWSGSDPNQFYSDEWLDKIIGDLGVSIWRNELYPHIPVYDNTTPNQDAAWAEQKPMVQALKAKADQYGTDLKVILTVWSPPGVYKWWSEMAWAGDVNALRGPTAEGDYHSEKFGGTLNPNKYTEFANWLIAGLQMYKDAGVDVYAISPQNEPAFSQEFNSNTYTTYWYRDMVKAVAPLVKAKFPEVKIFGAENMLEQEGADHNWPHFYHSVLIKDAEAMKNIDILAYHGYSDGVSASSGTKLADYWTNTREIFAEPFNKKQWMTETSGYVESWEGGTKPGAFGLGLDIYSALKYGNVSGWVWWQGSDLGTSIGEYAMMNGMETGPKYNVSKHYYRFIRPEAVRVEANSGDTQIYTLAFKNPVENSHTIILLNSAAEDKTISLASMGTGFPAEFEMYVSSATLDFVARGNVKGSITLPARSIITLQAGGTGLEKNTMASSDNKALLADDLYRGVNVYPNPANQKVKVSLHSEEGKTVTVEITNMISQKVASRQYFLKEGRNEVELGTSLLREGMYVVTVIQGEQKTQSKLIIKRN